MLCLHLYCETARYGLWGYTVPLFTSWFWHYIIAYLLPYLLLIYLFIYFLNY